MCYSGSDIDDKDCIKNSFIELLLSVCLIKLYLSKAFQRLIFVYN